MLDVERYVGKAIESVLARPTAVLEIICVDDGSSDRSVEVASEFLGNSKVEVVVLRQAHAGASAARNLGLFKASGDYVQFLDADDLLLPQKLEHQLQLIKAEDRRVDAVWGEFAERDEASQLVIPPRPVVEDPWLGLLQGGGRCGITSSNLWRREFLVELGGWDESLCACQDSELALRALEAGASIVRDLRPLTIKLGRIRGAIWSAGRSHADLVSRCENFVDLRRRTLALLAERGALTRTHVAGARAGVKRILERHGTKCAREVRILREGFEAFCGSLDEEHAPGRVAPPLVDGVG